tara:strand:- start:122 stop:292 length:171 start_codon:yes stop_codon:yes gene_type:complete
MKKGKLKENHFTADGALYKGDQVTIHTMDQITNVFRVETKDGKLYTVPQKKISLDK